MTLLQLQQTFVILIAKLIIHATGLGYKLTFGENYRSDGKGHKKNSNHYIRLAQDFNLFIDGEYRTETEAHEPLGEFWESLSTKEYKCCWGGSFGDGNHYSIEYQGRK